DRNQTPIISPRIRAGASLVTTLRPTGLTQSSPSSETKYVAISHHGLTRTPAALCAVAPAGTRIRKARPMNSTPIANFAGTGGSRDPRRIHSHANAGASRITKIGGTDWNQDDGNDAPNMSRRVYRSAKRLRVEPACSYAPQNRLATRKKMTIAPIR